MPTTVKERKRWAPTEKATIVIEGLSREKDVNSIAEEHGINPTQFYAWKKQLMENAHRVFTTKKEFCQDSGTNPSKDDQGTVKKLRRELGRCKDVVVALVEENVQLRRTSSGI